MAKNPETIKELIEDKSVYEMIKLKWKLGQGQMTSKTESCLCMNMERFFPTVKQENLSKR